MCFRSHSGAFQGIVVARHIITYFGISYKVGKTLNAWKDYSSSLVVSKSWNIWNLEGRWLLKDFIEETSQGNFWNLEGSLSLKYFLEENKKRKFLKLEGRFMEIPETSRERCRWNIPCGLQVMEIQSKNLEESLSLKYFPWGKRVMEGHQGNVVEIFPRRKQVVEKFTWRGVVFFSATFPFLILSIISAMALMRGSSTFDLPE